MLVKSFFIIILLFAVGGLAHLATENPGQAVFWWYGYEVRTTAVFMAGAFLLLCFLFFIWGWFWAFLEEIPHKYERWRNKKQQKEGLDKLYLALEAMAIGDNELAIKNANKAGKLLEDKRLSALVKLEAGADSDIEADADYFTPLQIESKSTKPNFITAKALLHKAELEENWPQALKFSEQLYRLKPKNTWVLEQVFAAKIHNQLYEEALNMVPQLRRYGVFSAEGLDFQEACIYMKLAENFHGENQHKKALKTIAKGVKSCPTFAPLALLQCQILQHIGKPKDAEKALGKFWQTCPQLNIFDKWLDLVAQSTPLALVDKAEKLTKLHDDNLYGQLALAVAYIHQRNWKSAREQLIKAVRTEPNKTAYKMLAELEEAVAPNAKAGYEWLQKAVDAQLISAPCHDFVKEYQAWCDSYVLAELVETDGEKGSILLGIEQSESKYSSST